MKNNKISIGYSPLTDKIYNGKQNKEKIIWIGDKEGITNDFINILFNYIPERKSRIIKGLDNNSENILLNVNKSKENIQKTINFLNNILNENLV